MSDKTMVQLLRELLASVDDNAGWNEAAESAADAHARELDALAAGGRVLTCAFCAQQYPQETAAAGAQVLVDHIRVCPEHPMRALEQRRDRLVAAMKAVVGADDLGDLRNMIDYTVPLAASNEDARIGLVLMRALAAELELQKAEVPA